MKPDFLPDLETAKRLILELSHQGVRLGTKGRHVTFDAPRGVLTAETKELLRVNKPLVHSLLRRAMSTAAPADPRVAKHRLAPIPQRRLHCMYPSHVDWLSIHGARICRICHPPAAPDLIAREQA